jgi:hypothetical protein
MRHDYPQAEHPSFGMIGVHRMSVGGKGETLFGSESRHHTVLGITIRHAYGQRDLTHDNVYGTGDVLIEVEMSESQFGRLLTQPNIGDGVPCTIRMLKEDGEYKRIEAPPLPPRKSDRFRTDMAQRTTRALTELRSLQQSIMTAVSDGALRKQRGETLLRKLDAVRTEIVSNIPWVSERFEEDMEESLDEAKADLAAYMDRIAAKIGVSPHYLDDADEQPPLVLAAENE